MRADIQLKLSLQSLERLEKLRKAFKLDSPEEVVGHALSLLEEAEKRATKKDDGHQYISMSGIPTQEEVSAVIVKDADPVETEKLLSKLIDPIDLKPYRG